MRRKRLVYFLVVTLFATSVWALNYWTPKSPTGSSVGLKIDSGQDALINGTLHVTTPTAWYMNNIAFTGTMTLLNAVTDGSVLTTQHYHSALSASDGSPNPALSVDATGSVSIASGSLTATLTSYISDSNTATDINNAIVGLQLKNTNSTVNNYMGISNRDSGNHYNAFIGFVNVDHTSVGNIILGTGQTGTVAERMRINGVGNVFINDTANANSTLGLTINQGANDDYAFSLKSSDVDHNIATEAEADSYALMKKSSAADGGLLITTLTDSTSTGISSLKLLEMLGGAASTAHNAGGIGGVEIGVYLKSGTGLTSIGADGCLLSVANGASTKFIIDAEGDLFADGSAPTIYDDYDDVAVISTMDKLHAEMSNKKLSDSAWEDFTKYNEQDLINMGILGDYRVNVAPEKRGLINYTGLVRLHNGAIRQLGRSIGETEYRVGSVEERQGSVEQRLAQLEMRELFCSPTIWGRN